MVLYDCVIKPETPFHLGNKENSVEHTLNYIPSDTLFGAFCNIYRYIYGNEELEGLLKEFSNKPPFCFSSVFPCINGNRLYPTPKHIDFRDWSVQSEKSLKRVSFVDENLFRLILQGKRKEISEEDIAQDGEVIITDYSGEIWNNREIPRVALNRMNSKSDIFYFNEVVFNDRLHFLVDIADKKYLDMIKTVFTVLGDEGIGGDRTYGKGLFTLEGIEKISFEDFGSGWFVTLSLLNPQPDDISELTGYFTFTDRGGWGYSLDDKNIRKKVLRLFTEGSVFNKFIRGRLVEVAASKHIFYRNGLGLNISIKVDS